MALPLSLQGTHLRPLQHRQLKKNKFTKEDTAVVVVGVPTKRE